MYPLRSLASYYRRNRCLLGHHGSLAPNPITSRLPGMPVSDQGRWYTGHHWQYSDQKPPGGTGTKSDGATARNPSSLPPPPRLHCVTWARWALGSVITMILHFWSEKWNALLRIEGEVEMAAERVEDAAEVVEEIATVAEEVSSELAAMLPEDGKLKDALLLVEHVAKEAVEEAHLVQDIFHKVDEVKQEVEMLLEPGKLMHEEGNIVKRKP